MAVKSKEAITVCEFDCIYGGANKLHCECVGAKGISEDAFRNLESFVIANDQNDSEAASHFMQLTSKHGVKMIQAQNYVGVITTRDGTTIEILPKLAKSGTEEGLGVEGARRAFLEMLRCLRKAPWRHLGKASQRIERMPLYEVFICMFIDEVEQIAKRGFHSGYIYREGNLYAVKGKLLIKEHLQNNCVDQSRAYVRFSSYELDRPENRLLKSALEYLLRKTANASNRVRMQRLCDLLVEVCPSRNHADDFRLFQQTRENAHYVQALDWAMVFLAGKAFTAFRGDTVSTALLFPMERIFEDYIASLSKRAIAQMRSEGSLRGWHIEVQQARWRLFGQDGARLKPDIVLYDQDGPVCVFDTKWKRLEGRESRPSASDQYQLFAYGQRLEAKRVVLIYPSSGAESDGWSSWTFHSDSRVNGGGFSVRSFFVDLSGSSQALTCVSQMLREAAGS